MAYSSFMQKYTEKNNAVLFEVRDFPPRLIGHTWQIKFSRNIKTREIFKIDKSTPWNEIGPHFKSRQDCSFSCRRLFLLIRPAEGATAVWLRYVSLVTAIQLFLNNTSLNKNCASSVFDGGFGVNWHCGLTFGLHLHVHYDWKDLFNCFVDCRTIQRVWWREAVVRTRYPYNQA